MLDTLPTAKPLMPQGVEHFIIKAATGNYLMAAKPLMPQGVEHISPASVRAKIIHCQTSDAARR